MKSRAKAELKAKASAKAEPKAKPRAKATPTASKTTKPDPATKKLQTAVNNLTRIVSDLAQKINEKEDESSEEEMLEEENESIAQGVKGNRRGQAKRKANGEKGEERSGKITKKQKFVAPFTPMNNSNNSNYFANPPFPQPSMNPPFPQFAQPQRQPVQQCLYCHQALFRKDNNWICLDCHYIF
jgi:hypothetical protein